MHRSGGNTVFLSKVHGFSQDLHFQIGIHYLRSTCHLYVSILGLKYCDGGFAERFGRLWVVLPVCDWNILRSLARVVMVYHILPAGILSVF